MNDRNQLRRANDREAASLVEDTLLWVKRGPRILVAAFAFMSGTAATAAWFGAQSSSPAQRITRLEFRVDSGFRAVAQDIDQIRIRQNQSAADWAVIAEKVDLLLRLSCPNISRADLIRACREQGVTR